MRSSKSLASVACLLTLLGCAGTQTGPQSRAGNQSSSALERFLPLENNTVFSYETFIEETNERGLAVVEVSRPRDNLAELRIAGKVKKRYHISADGMQTSGGGYVLKAPLALGAEWQGDDGKVNVTAMDRGITVPAGKFTGCLETVENVQFATSAYRQTTTVFCPGVGITLLQIKAEQDGEHVLQRLSLKSFGPRFSAR